MIGENAKSVSAFGGANAKSVEALDAAKTVGHHLNWEISNLRMHKVLYMAHMLYMGKHDGTRLIADDFEAWKYGPVIRNVYYRLKDFGKDSIAPDAFSDRNFVESAARAEYLKDAADMLVDIPSYELVDLTHHPRGAWAKVYVANSETRPVLRDEDIVTEYQELYYRGGRYRNEKANKASHG